MSREISSELIKKLRNETGSGIMECKKALLASANDFALAKETLRLKAKERAIKKQDRIALEGALFPLLNGEAKELLALEVNCETDFVANSDYFREAISRFLRENAGKLADSTLKFEQAKEWFAETYLDLFQHVDENIVFRRLMHFQAPTIVSYSHQNGSILVVALFETLSASQREYAELAIPYLSSLPASATFFGNDNALCNYHGIGETAPMPTNLRSIEDAAHLAKAPVRFNEEAIAFADFLRKIEAVLSGLFIVGRADGCKKEIKNEFSDEVQSLIDRHRA